jgi:hypothetical protein
LGGDHRIRMAWSPEEVERLLKRAAEARSRAHATLEKIVRSEATRAEQSGIREPRRRAPGRENKQVRSADEGPASPI